MVKISVRYFRATICRNFWESSKSATNSVLLLYCFHPDLKLNKTKSELNFTSGRRGVTLICQRWVYRGSKSEHSPWQTTQNVQLVAVNTTEWLLNPAVDLVDTERDRACWSQSAAKAGSSYRRLSELVRSWVGCHFLEAVKLCFATWHWLSNQLSASANLMGEQLSRGRAAVTC